MSTAVSYFVGCRLPMVIDAEVSTSIQAGIRRGASYSLTCTFPTRAVTRQSIDFTASPGW